MGAGRPHKIAILGGGMAALTTAYELTREANWRERYAITIYQQGHRLGGKCASARARRTTRSGTVERIEEHGLHVFFGYYENAFRLMRDCYRELARIPEAPWESHRLSWEEAFVPHDLVLFGDDGDAGMRSWTIPFPRRRGQHGVGADPRVELDGASVLTGLLELAASTLLRAADLSVDELGARVSGERELEQLFDRIRETSADEDLVAVLARGVRIASARLPSSFDPTAVVRALRALELLVTRVGATRIARAKGVRVALASALEMFRTLFLRSLAASERRSFTQHQLRASLDFFFTIAIGLLRDDMLRSDVDWFAFDHLDYRDWLRMHGGSEEMVQSAPLRALGDAVFADASSAGWSAGTTLHLVLRTLLTYKHSILCRFGAGTGEVLIAPLYRVLAARGVRFEFFFRVERLIPEASGQAPRVETIEYRRQASVRTGRDAYQPLQAYGGTLCWPPEPDYAQLEEGARLRASGHDLESSWNAWDARRPVEKLERGRDFDTVVLAIGLGGLRTICAELAKASERLPRSPRGAREPAPRFSEMLKNVRTVETLGVQLWLKRGLSQLGGPADHGIGIAYPQPLDTWAEMNHLLVRERWPASNEPAALLYLCSNIEEPPGYEPPPFSDHGHPSRQRKRVAQMTKAWLDAHGRRVFAGARAGDRFDYDLLVDPDERSGEARFDAQLYCATVNPSDRYVLSCPNTNRFRLRPHESGFRNLVLAGDWTLSSISAGCVEGAVTSGCDAARALIGKPAHVVGDWLTRVRPELLAPPMLEENTVQPPSDADAFVRMPFDLLSMPPYVCKRAQSDWFFFHADVAPLQALCDRYLNYADSPTHYAVLAPVIAFVATQTAASYSDVEHTAFLPEKDFGFWIPVRARAREGRTAEHVASPIAWFQPALWVDSQAAASDGREVLGLSKMVALLEGPTPQRASFTIDTLAARRMGRADDPAAPTLECTMERILELQLDPSAQLSSHLAAVSALSKFSVRGLADLVSGPTAALAPLLRQLREGTVALVGLKQFPDARDPRRACYKAIVETPSRATEVRHVRVRPGRHELRLFDLASHPIAETLGLRAERAPIGSKHAVHARSFLAVEIDFDFVVDEGRVVFDALANQHRPNAAGRAASAQVMAYGEARARP